MQLQRFIRNTVQILFTHQKKSRAVLGFGSVRTKILGKTETRDENTAFIYFHCAGFSPALIFTFVHYPHTANMELKQEVDDVMSVNMKNNV